MPRPRPGVVIDDHVPGSAWQDRALCRGSDPELFYPVDKITAEEAKARCTGCVVRAECLEYAIEMRERHGIWGGTTEHERRRIIKMRRLQSAA